jgi:hypothetical protein
MTVRIITDSNGRKHITNEPLLHQPAPVQPDYKQLYEQVCEQYDVLAKEFEAIKQALAAQPAPVQEPVAWMYESVCGNDFATRHDPPDYAKNIRPLYTTPRAAQRQWVGLSQDELDAMFSNTIKGKKLVNYVARAIEAKLKEKNNG